MATRNPDSSLPAKVLPASLEKSIAGLSQPVAAYLADLSLPTEDVLAPVEERRKVVNGLADALHLLPLEAREKAYYLSKFTVAVAVGLFDGAVNYLWNETVRALRSLVARTDLSYFFLVAEQVNNRNRDLKTEEDLEAVQDHDLLEVCRRIGLLSDVNYRRLEHVNYMRNHASAAHPNDQEVDGHELLGWVSVCLKYAITAEPDASVVIVTRLLENMRTQIIPASDFQVIGQEVGWLRQERVDDLLWALFGLYIDPRQGPDVKTNIKNIAPFVWQSSSEDRRYEIGARYGLFRKNADIPRKDAAFDFLAAVEGQNYRDEDSLAAELLDKLQALKSAHFGWGNFYNEYPHAKSLTESLPTNRKVPRSARPFWVKVIVLCYVGNGLGYKRGVDERALPHYEKYVSYFGDNEIAEFLRLFADPEFSSTLDRPLTDRRCRELANRLLDQTERAALRAGLQLVQAAPAKSLVNIVKTTAFKEVLANLPK
ncbi:MAG TPA: hypothetical protein VGG03_17225 [Thermoanaerobaculia bacterium]